MKKQVDTALQLPTRRRGMRAVMMVSCRRMTEARLGYAMQSMRQSNSHVSATMLLASCAHAAAAAAEDKEEEVLVVVVVVCALADCVWQLR
jgi:hypothetical protein